MSDGEFVVRIERPAMSDVSGLPSHGPSFLKTSYKRLVAGVGLGMLL